MKIGHPQRAQSGMSLVEVVMAVGLLGIMAGGFFGSFRYGFFTLQLVRENQRATQVLLEKVETIRLYSWDQINSNGFVPPQFIDWYDPQATNINARGVTYTGTAIVTTCPLASSYATNMRQLSLTLNWTTGTIPHKRSLNTYIARDGIQCYVW
jgi:prepilin-type N-terminal cleavage/methylation domain-containing protein